MSTIANQALEKLLRSAENAYWKEPSGRAIKLGFTARSFPQYFAITTHAEKESCHGDLLLAMRAGAITIKWERQAGEKNQIEFITLQDSTKLASFLGITPRWDAVAAAESQLSGLYVDYQVLQDVISMWRRGMKPRGTSIEDIKDWVDAIRVIETCKNSTTLDIPVRRISALLTFDSKRVELLWNIIDALLQGDVNLSQRSAEEVFAEIGLIKYPPTILISGKIQVLVTFHQFETTIKVERPYIGLSPSVISGFIVESSPITLLSVENLTTFHELSTKNDNFENCILLFTGGMPSPSWKRVYKLILNALPIESKVFHWGDIDIGGFRIAKHLAACCKDVGKVLELHMMELGEASFSKKDVIRRELTDKEISEIENICLICGWQKEYTWIASNKFAIEQESLSASWPKLNRQA